MIILLRKDTGKGIERKNLPHVFERFAKFDSFIQGTGTRAIHLPNDPRESSREDRRRVGRRKREYFLVYDPMRCIKTVA